jgi:hypothetical protein
VIANSQNKAKTMWRIIKFQTNNTVHQSGIESLKINNTVTDNKDDIAHAFNAYFISVADSVVNNISGKTNYKNNRHTTDYLNLNYGHYFPDIQWKYISTYEIQNIIKLLKLKNSFGFDEISMKVLKISS